jgi:hypothetical protein
MKEYTITVNGVAYDVTVDEKGNGGTSADPAATPVAKAAAPAVTPVPAQKSSQTGNIPVTAPMPGKVLAVKVKVGDSVTSGAPVLVLEAMKMENDIVAPKDGKVVAVNVKAGDSVESGAVLVSLEG